MVETAGLEAAMLGLDIDGRVVVGRSTVPDIEPRLQSLLEAWWTETHHAGGQAIVKAHRQASQWLEIAQIAADGSGVSVRATGTGPATAEVAAAEVAAVEPDAGEPSDDAGRLPVALQNALTDATHHQLEQLLVSMLDALEDPSLDEAATPVDQADGATHAPQRGIAPDGFDLFWGRDRATVSTEQRRSVVIDAIMPMAVVSLILVAVLAWIG